MPEINCNICTRRKHCFVKEFEVLSCEDYNPEDSAEYEEERKSDEKLFTNTN